MKKLTSNFTNSTKGGNNNSSRSDPLGIALAIRL